MGIKNLAFCVAEVKLGGSTSEEDGTIKSNAGTKMNVISWRRLDVVEEVSRSMEKRKEETESVVNKEDTEDPYTPSALSSTAYTLLAQTLLPYKPDIILIERQRWRSSGGVAVQQWTVRVNTLEGMLWAILTALRAVSKSTNSQNQTLESRNSGYEIFGVDPKRVGNFWMGENLLADSSKKWKKEVEDELVVGPEGEVEEFAGGKRRSAVKKLSRGKAEKKAKIQLLRSWLTPEDRSTVASHSRGSSDELGGTSPAIGFTFSPDAETTRAALCTTEKAKGGRKRAKTDVPELKKLDDVTDCFLQAAAWVAWEANRTKMVHDWDSEQGRLRSLDGVDKEAIEAVKPKRISKTTTKISGGKVRRSKTDESPKKTSKRPNKSIAKAAG